MQSHRVIPTLDVAKAGHLRLGLRCEPATAEQLGLEGGEEALGHGIVVGVTDRPHRWSNTGLATPLAKCHRRILGGFKRPSQQHDGDVAMTTRKRRSDRSGRALLRSPGRPPVAGRDERRRFWVSIVAGLSSEDAAVGAGVPQAVGARWFRKAGGMPPAMFRRSAKPLSGRYLSLAEREELAILRAQDLGVRDLARRMGRSASTISRELRRNAATRSGG